MRASDLWRWEGRVSRAAYAVVGLAGVALKHNVDRVVASSFLGYKNSFNYWAPLGKAARLDHLSDTEARFLAALLLVSIPFIWVGVAMTVKRLRDAGQPVWLVVLFFVPFVNLLFFLLLCTLAPQERSQEFEGAPWPGPHGIDRFIPHSKLGSAALSLMVTTVLGLGFVLMIEVNAPPEKVWNEVVAFAEIPPPTELLFRAGIAYPIHAEISEHGVGAVRHCIFSTGSFVEPIEVWDEPHLLKFRVTANPAPLNELTPYGHIDAPHLHGYFVSEQGQFLLKALPGGRTRLEGTTWYHNAMWPTSYWHLWSDYIIHRIHLRVLDHIRSEAEAANR